jgi:hypothetical protein
VEAQLGLFLILDLIHQEAIHMTLQNLERMMYQGLALAMIIQKVLDMML